MSGSNLSNEQFRVLMMTPRGGSAPALSSPMQPPPQKTTKKKKKNTSTKPQNIKDELLKKYEVEEDNKQKDEGKYRDRSKERRESDELENEEELRKFNIEESKFLGGDLEHTHLVKGLDYALLHRMKAEMDTKPSEEESKPQNKLKQKVEEKQAFSCNTVLARRLYNQLVSKPSSVPSIHTDKFLPGRTTLVFDLTSTSATDLPTTYIRSKEDCPVMPDTKKFSCDSQILQKIGSIVSYLQNGKNTKKKQHPRIKSPK